MDNDIDALFESHGDIWENIRDYWNKYREVPSIDYVMTEFSDFDPSPINSPTQFYVDQLKNDHTTARLRDALLRAGSALKDTPPEKVMDELQSNLATISKHSNNVSDLDITDWQEAEKHFSATKERSDKMGGAPGIQTGFKAIDLSYPTGMAAGHYIVMIGYSGRGKTWFSAYLAVKAWQQGFKPMIVSLEMSDVDMRNRIYSLMASGLFKVSDFQRGEVDVDEFRTWSKRNLENHQTFPIVTNKGIGEITPAIIQAKIDQHKPDIIICDYMQLMTDNRRSDSMTPRMMNLSRELKLLATSNEIPIIAISAVTPDDHHSIDDPPMLEQVAWSRGIQFDADLAMAVHRHTDTNIIEVISRKSRHGTDFGVYLNVDLNNGIIEERFEGLE